MHPPIELNEQTTDEAFTMYSTGAADAQLAACRATVLLPAAVTVGVASHHYGGTVQ